MAGLWFVDKVFVVDAIFATKRQPLELQNFIFSACTLKDELKRECESHPIVTQHKGTTVKLNNLDSQ